MTFTQDDKQKIASLLKLASLGVTANSGSGVKVQAYNCPCGGNCAGGCTGTSFQDCICNGSCADGLTFGLTFK